MSSTPPIIKLSGGSRSPTLDRPVIKIEDKETDTPPAAPTGKRSIGRPKGSRSNRELYLEGEVASLKSKCSNYRRSIQSLQEKFNEVSIEKVVATTEKAMMQEHKYLEIRALRHQNQVLRNQGKHDFLLYCVLWC
jgi:hypothetical protein